jgi:hypothetical protein
MRSKSARVQLTLREIGFVSSVVICYKCSVDLEMCSSALWWGRNEAGKAAILPSIAGRDPLARIKLDIT